MNLKIVFALIISLSTSEVYSQGAILKGRWHKKVISINGKNFVSFRSTIVVAESSDSSNTHKVILPVTVIKSSSPQPLEPVFWLGGGPGQANTFPFVDEMLLQNHDFVSVGYRGAEGNPILRSHSLSKSWKGKHGDILTDESLNNIEDETSKYLDHLKKKSVDITCYTLMHVVNDLWQAKQLLGYDKINLLSFSYGTRVALLFSYQYPGAVKRSLMVGANPPGGFVWDPLNTEAILDRYDSIYAALPWKKYSGSIKEAMAKAFTDMPKRWSIFKLSPEKIKCATFLSLYQKQNAVIGFNAYFKAAYENDYSGLYMAQLMYDIMIMKGIAGDFYQKAISADIDVNQNYRTYLRQTHTTLGSNLGLLAWGSSGAWPHKTIPEEYRHVRESKTETLILSGSLDPATPYIVSKQQLLPALVNGRQVVLKNFSHVDLLFTQHKHFNQFAAAYFTVGEVDTALFEPETVDFTSTKDLGRMAKRMFPLVIVLNLIY